MPSDNLVAGCLACAAMRRMEFEASLKLEHTCKTVASAAVEHEVKAGSCWRRKEGGKLVLVDETIYGHLGRVRVVDPEGRWDSRATPADFRLAFEWVADPGEKS